MNERVDDPWAEDEAVEFEAGRVLDERFEIRGMLGEGGLGTVYRAHDRSRGRELALKVLVPRYRGRPDREARLLLEGELYARARGVPGLLPYHGCGRLTDLGGCPYLAVGLVLGRSLNMKLAMDGPLSPGVAALAAWQLAEAIRGLHCAGVVHRDVTVQNIFVADEAGEQVLQLIDLSHGALLDPDEDTRLTQVHEVPGTPRYMSPEQARGLAADPAMDVYAFGVVLHEMLTGRNPFAALTVPAFLQSQSAGELPAPLVDCRVYPGVPEPLAELVAACTDHDPSQRPDMNAVVQRLGWILAQTSIEDRRPRPELPARARPAT